MDAFVGSSWEVVGVLEGLKTGKSTLVGPVVGALVGDLVGALVGPLMGPLVVPLVDPLVGHGSLSPALCVSRNLAFAFAFVLLKVIKSEMILFRFALISVSMVRSVCAERGRQG